MQRGLDMAGQFERLTIVHQNLPSLARPRHHHDWAELIIPLGGSIAVNLAEGGSLTCDRGEMVFVPARVEHSFVATGADGERVILIVDPAWIGVEDEPARLLPINTLVVELAVLLVTDSAARGLPHIMATMRYALELAFAGGPALSTLRQGAARLRDPRARRAYACIETHRADGDVLKRAAKAAATSERHLGRLFAKELGHSPKEIVRALRMERAKELLASGKYSVTAVALEVGYQSLSQFIKTFHDATGVLPYQFRASSSS
jgi:AraC-like DNA-binding protein